MKIEPLTTHQLAELNSLISGYTTSEKYLIKHHEAVEEITFRLKLQTLPEPITISFADIGGEEMARYKGLVNNGCCFGAVADGQLVGAAIAETQEWNQTLWVWEILVAPSRKRQGVGRLLMEQLIETAVSRNLRAVVCETQSQNVPAIRFYRKMGFVLDGVDISYYSNKDYEPKQDVAIFMKRKIL